MQITCIITEIYNSVDKNILYSIEFETGIEIISKKDIPKIIDFVLNKILETNIPEELENKVNKRSQIEFNIIGNNINISFIVKDKIIK